MPQSCRTRAEDSHSGTRLRSQIVDLGDLLRMNSRFDCSVGMSYAVVLAAILKLRAGVDISSGPLMFCIAPKF